MGSKRIKKLSSTNMYSSCSKESSANTCLHQDQLEARMRTTMLGQLMRRRAATAS